jgi:RsiW-degrading membrane proteinase PrsW (M82 family)
MSLDEDTLRYGVEILLATAAAMIAVYLWFVDISTLQRVFGALLGSELMIFATLIYVYYKPTMTGPNSKWLLMGCTTAAVFLLIAVQLGSH